MAINASAEVPSPAPEGNPSQNLERKSTIVDIEKLISSKNIKPEDKEKMEALIDAHHALKSYQLDEAIFDEKDEKAFHDKLDKVFDQKEVAMPGLRQKFRIAYRYFHEQKANGVLAKSAQPAQPEAREGKEETDNGPEPEKKALNYLHVKEYLDERQIDKKNFDEKFHLSTAVDFLGGKDASPDERKMMGALIKAQNELTTNKIDEKLFDEEGEAVFQSKLHKALADQKISNPQLEENLLSAHKSYQQVRTFCENQLRFKQEFIDLREQEKIKVSTGIEKDVAGALQGAKRNWNTMSGKEKAGAVVVGLIGAVMLLSSDNPRVEKFKEGLFTLLKIGLVGYGVNSFAKIITGETLLTSISKWSEDTIENEDTWTDHYGSKEAGAAMRKSVVYLGDQDFFSLAENYERSKGKSKLELATVDSKRMSPEESFLALSAFDKKYNVEKLVKEYKKQYKGKGVRLTWKDVVGSEMVKDGRIEIKDSALSRASEATQGYARRATNFLALGIPVAWDKEKEWTGDGWNWVKKTYKETFGKEGTSEEMQEWAKKALINSENDAKGVEDFVRRHHVQPDASASDRAAYLSAYRKPTFDDPAFQVKFHETKDGIHLVTETKLSNEQLAEPDGKGYKDAMQRTRTNAENFLKKKYGIKENIGTFMVPFAGVYVANENSYQFFVRMPKLGTREFNERNKDHWTEEDRKDRTENPQFGPTDKLDLNKTFKESWEKEALRARYHLDASQTRELQKLCLYFTAYFKDKGYSLNKVKQMIFEDPQTLKAGEDELKRLKVKQPLLENQKLLDQHEATLNAVEKTTAKKLDTNAISRHIPFVEAGDKDAHEYLERKMKAMIGYKVRLAILGDKDAIAYFKRIDAEKFTPSTDKSIPMRRTWVDYLLKYHEEQCEDILEKFQTGVLK